MKDKILDWYSNHFYLGTLLIINIIIIVLLEYKPLLLYTFAYIAPFLFILLILVFIYEIINSKGRAKIFYFISMLMFVLLVYIKLSI